MAKRSLAQRMKDRGSDLDAAERQMVAGKKPPAVGGVRAPASNKKPVGKKR